MTTKMWQCMSLTEKTEFPFFVFPYVRVQHIKGKLNSTFTRQIQITLLSSHICRQLLYWWNGTLNEKCPFANPTTSVERSHTGAQDKRYSYTSIRVHNGQNAVQLMSQMRNTATFWGVDSVLRAEGVQLTRHLPDRTTRNLTTGPADLMWRKHKLVFMVHNCARLIDGVNGQSLQQHKRIFTSFKWKCVGQLH